MNKMIDFAKAKEKKKEELDGKRLDAFIREVLMNHEVMTPNEREAHYMEIANRPMIMSVEESIAVRKMQEMVGMEETGR